MLIAYVHSLIDYEINIWAVWRLWTNCHLKLTQDSIDRFLTSYFLPGLLRKCKKIKSYNVIRSNINVHKLRADCKFTSILERLDFVIFNNMFKDYCRSKLTFSIRTQSKSMPLVVTPTFSSQIFQNYIRGMYPGVFCQIHECLIRSVMINLWRMCLNGSSLRKMTILHAEFQLVITNERLL